MTDARGVHGDNSCEPALPNRSSFLVTPLERDPRTLVVLGETLITRAGYDTIRLMTYDGRPKYLGRVQQFLLRLFITNPEETFTNKDIAYEGLQVWDQAKPLASAAINNSAFALSQDIKRIFEVEPYEPSAIVINKDAETGRVHYSWTWPIEDLGIDYGFEE